VNDDDRATELRVVRSLYFASMDMGQAHLAAVSIPDPAYSRVRSLLEAALAVGYARPFTRSDAGMKLDPEWKPEGPDDLALHDGLIDLRHQVYAHTDDNEYRYVLSAAATIDGVSDVPALFITRRLDDEWVALAAQMILRQRGRFMRARVAEEQRLLGDADVFDP
jgi:hypothetical protein